MPTENNQDNLTTEEPKKEDELDEANLSSRKLKDLLAKARKEEKDKLYETIQKLEKENKDREKRENELALALQNLSTPKPEEKEFDMKEALRLQREAWEKETANLVNRLESEMKGLQETVHQQTLRADRGEVLLEYGSDGKIIPEIVGGNSRLELEESALMSRKIFEAYEKKLESQILSKYNIQAGASAQGVSTVSPTVLPPESKSPQYSGIQLPPSDGVLTVTSPSLDLNNTQATTEKDLLEKLQSLPRDEQRTFFMQNKDKILAAKANLDRGRGQDMAIAGNFAHGSLIQ